MVAPHCPLYYHGCFWLARCFQRPIFRSHCVHDWRVGDFGRQCNAAGPAVAASCRLGTQSLVILIACQPSVRRISRHATSRVRNAARQRGAMNSRASRQRQAHWMVVAAILSPISSKYRSLALKHRNARCTVHAASSCVSNTICTTPFTAPCQGPWSVTGYSLWAVVAE